MYTCVCTGPRTDVPRHGCSGACTLVKYGPADGAAQVRRWPAPVSLHIKRRNCYCGCTDLEGFTKLSQAVTPKTVALLLDEYIGRLCDIVLDHGGWIDR